MATQFYYIRADECVSAYAGVSVPNLAATYLAAWLCDMRAGRPVQSSDANFGATITPLAAGEVGLVAVCNHDFDPAEVITFGGDISTTCTVGAVQPDEIPYNPWSAITPVAGVDNVTVSATGNSTNPTIGEIMFGKRRSLPLPPHSDDGLGGRDFSMQPAIDLASIPGYDPALDARVWTPKCLLTASEVEDAWKIFKAQRNGTRPTLVVPDISKAYDAWVAFMAPPKWAPADPGVYSVDLTFIEVPRVRWP